MKAPVVILCAISIISCGKKETDPKEVGAGGEPSATFYLVTYNGEQEIAYSDDWIEALPKLTAQLEPLWENLESGESQEFAVRVSERIGLSQESCDSPGEQGGLGREVKPITPFTSPSYRFFRRGENGSGLEKVGKDGEKKEEFAGDDPEWEEVELALRVALVPILGPPLGDGEFRDYYAIAEELARKGKGGE